MTVPFNLDSVRHQFPALSRTHNGQPVVFFDGPAGSQVPQSVADAVSLHLLQKNANHGAPFATSVESDAILDEAHRAAADLVGASDPDEIAFGANMTTMTLALSRALAKTWNPGDEIIVTRLDHDANVTPWTLAAADAGATVKHVEFRPDDCTLDIDDFQTKLTDRTRLVAVGYASNATGGINPITEMTRLSHAAGARVFIDAVHYAPHGSIDIAQIGCDFLACSAYKFFGPHVGVMWGRRELLESITPYKLRPSPNELPGRWMTGTQNHEGIAGVLAAIDYLADLGRTIEPADSRRDALCTAFNAIGEYERELCQHLLTGLADLPALTVHGITDFARHSERVPTVSFTHATHSPGQIAERLADRGIFVWSGNHYAIPFTEARGLEPGGTLRVGALHYNTTEEIDRLLRDLAQITK